MILLVGPEVAFSTESKGALYKVFLPYRGERFLSKMAWELCVRDARLLVVVVVMHLRHH